MSIAVRLMSLYVDHNRDRASISLQNNRLIDAEAQNV
jgi:hypothetical protein